MELSHVLTSLAHSAAMTLRADAAAVCLLDESGDRLSVAAVYGLPAGLLERAPQQVQSCALDREALAGRLVLVVDAWQDVRVELPDENLRAAVCIALIHQDDPLGTLHVYATQPARFGEDAVAMLKPLADLGAANIAAARALTALETLEARQAQFVHVATHELRSPVTVSQSLVRGVLKGYAGAMTEKQAEVFTRISRRLDLLESLINDLLDLAAGKAQGPAKEEPVMLNTSIGRVMLLLQPRAEEKDIRMTLEPCRDHLIVLGSEQGLDRIFVNLVGNAVKYTLPGGNVTVSMQQMGGHAQVEVSDTGIGIPEESLSHLFEEFYRAPNAKKLAEAGTGLGLAIVKDLVEHYGGHIQVDSVVGKGTTFTVSLPLVSSTTT